jgi:hypothetical protein
LTSLPDDGAAEGLGHGRLDPSPGEHGVESVLEVGGADLGADASPVAQSRVAVEKEGFRGDARTELVGEPPMSYLTSWRLALAADLLREPDATVGAVARQVGYGSAFALSAAFKRVRGVSPQEHRAAVTSTP